MTDQELTYSAALDIHHSILVKMKEDLTAYKDKNPTLTPGQKIHVEIREQQILKLLEFQNAADQLIIYLKAAAEQKAHEIIIPDSAIQINDLNQQIRKLKYKLSLAETQNNKQSDFLELIGWNKSSLNQVTNTNWKETKRDLSIKRAKEHFNF